MAIIWTGTGGLATRMGILGGALNELNAARGAALDARVATINGQYLSALQKEIAGLYAARDAYRSSPSQWTGYLQTLAQNTLMDQVDAQAAYKLVPRSVQQAVLIAVQDMVDNAVTVQRPGSLNVSATPAGGNAGDGVLVATITGGDGLPLALAYNESLSATVTGDRSTGSTALAEPVSVVGVTRADTKFDFDWPTPKGSGTNLAINLVNGGSTTLPTLLGTAGAMEAWTAAGSDFLPTGATALVGTVGTTIKRSTSPLTGTYSLSYLGNGSELTSVFFPISGTLQPLTVYAVSAWVSSTTGAYAGGQVDLSLTNSAGTVVNDQAGNANTVSLAATGANAYPLWTNRSGFFRTPKVVPAGTLGVTLKFGTALAAAEVLVFDHLALVAATQLYPGGPYVAPFSGGTEARRGDSFLVTVGNNANLLTPGNGAMQFLFDRLFNTREQGVLLPSASSPTVSDGLIV